VFIITEDRQVQPLDRREPATRQKPIQSMTIVKIVQDFRRLSPIVAESIRTAQFCRLVSGGVD